MAEKRKRKTLPPRGDPKLLTPPAVHVRDRLGAELDEREEFGENTFAGALSAVKHVLERAATAEKGSTKPRKKG